MAATTVITDEEIIQKLKEITATVLMMSPDEISPDASLIDDLGMESIDFLDITFKLEEVYGIQIPRKPVFQRMMDRFGKDALIKDGKLSLKGVEVLLLSFPDMPSSRIHEGMSVEEVPSLITLRTYVNVVKRGLALAAWHPEACHRCDGTDFISIDKSTMEFTDDEVPLGPVFECVGCNAILTAPSFDEPIIQKVAASA